MTVLLILFLTVLSVLPDGSGEVGEPSQLSRYNLERKEPLQFTLPSGLREASGLAVSSDGRLFCHDDERGVVYEIDPADGSRIKRFSLGRLTIDGDFEGIAIKQDTMFLVSSDGVIYQFLEAGDGDHVRYTYYTTPLSAGNDVEGLEYDEETDCLLLACKGVAGLTREERKEWEDFKAVYEFSLETKTLNPLPRFLVSLRELGKKGKKVKFNPSGIAKHPESGTYFVVAAQGGLVIELDREGKLVGSQECRKRANPQPEGIAIGPDQTMYLCNDGQGGKGTLTLFTPSPNCPPD
jgi:uncharacterized protein YjiK